MTQKKPTKIQHFFSARFCGAFVEVSNSSGLDVHIVNFCMPVVLAITIKDKLFDFYQPALETAGPAIKAIGKIMDKLVCEECGTSFNCGVPVGKNHCWCMELPNLRGSFDLAGSCVCPDCMTLGKAKSITQMRKTKKQQRAASSLRIKA